MVTHRQSSSSIKRLLIAHFFPLGYQDEDSGNKENSYLKNIMNKGNSYPAKCKRTTSVEPKSRQITKTKKLAFAWAQPRGPPTDPPWGSSVLIFVFFLGALD